MRVWLVRCTKGRVWLVRYTKGGLSLGRLVLLPRRPWIILRRLMRHCVWTLKSGGKPKTLN